MDSTLPYLALNRQIGLAREMDAVANNVANLATTGYRREGLVFAEFVRAAAPSESLSMADLGARFASERPGELTLTGGQLDIAIEGPGFFQVRLGADTLLTRAGNFQRSPEGLLVTPEGAEVLDDGGAAFRSRAQAAPLDEPRLRQGALEGSNVDPIAEIARMIAVSRAYERVQGLARDADERTSDTLRRLGQPV